MAFWANGLMAKTSRHDSARRSFLKGSTLVATSLCFTSPLARAAKLLGSDATSNPAISVLGKAYAGLAANYRQHQSNLSYTTSELRFSSDQRVFTQFKLAHKGGLDESGAQSNKAVQKEIQNLTRGMNFTAADLADNAQGFEPTVILYQGRVHTDESLIKAVRPLCAAVAREHKKDSGDAPVRAIALSPKSKGSFLPQVVIS
jgi:hypothetical protein